MNHGTPPTQAGDEFREDLRPLAATVARAGQGAAAARRVLGAQELAPLTRLNDCRSMGALALSVGVSAAAITFGLAVWPSPWVLASVLVVGVQQHGFFILAHEAAHYRLLSSRRLNDVLGRLIGMAGGISMCTYRVIHRLHHNHLYGPQDPDTAIHGGYPRGVAYLWKKLGTDLLGANAWKTYAYFFGAPAIRDETAMGGEGALRSQKLLNDTSADLRRAARQDRWWVVAAQLALPAASFGLGGWQGLAQYAVLWALPLLTVLQPILRLRAICEHGAVTDLGSPLTAARSNLTGPAKSGRAADTLLNLLGRALLFPHHVNHHLEHHLYPAVPHYHLPRLHRLLAAKGVLDGAEVRDLSDTFRRLFAPRPAHRAAPPTLPGASTP
ncbi:MAG: fatty acid desaturase family protein [Methylibium sp.]